MLSAEDRAEIEAAYEEVFGHKPIRRAKVKPVKLVCVGGQVIADADVIVSPSDVNWWRGMAVRRDGLIEVRAARPQRAGWRRI